ncbi:glycine zipper 2TM domain-containing protein [Asticcacaulis sp. BYS171W]|uniref:17 kDa surface antigen n=1 Tax=Asticcacaulis aquaticus TaxID=2984212 RepID=A0ABT5HX90_9CAUL|nr:glycine zipper 2TM domain-containing protein [Asticcacaulis aquaticus]MDC7684692.1 glycine zipper 2TM domain-containing protein [Asticcacaulis aquaticus]
MTQTKIILSAVALAGALSLAATAPASAQSYDGWCYQKESSARTKGTVIGAGAGAVVGNVVAGKGNKTEGTILGAIVGGVIGNQVGKKNKEKETASANCLSSRYYIYDRGYYTPDAPPEGYRVAYFNQRPYYDTYWVRRNGTDYVYRR